MGLQNIRLIAIFFSNLSIPQFPAHKFFRKFEEHIFSMFFHSESNKFLQLFIWPLYNSYFIFATKCNFYPETFQTKLQEVLDFLISSTVIGSQFFWCFCHQSFSFLLLAFEKMLCYFLIKLFTIEELLLTF